MSDGPLETALHPEHVRLGGKMVGFAGFSLPVHYEAGIHAEHRAVREAAGLFDVSHMGEIEIEGPDATACLQRLAVNDASLLAVGQAQYSMLCNESGGVVDDLLVSRFAEARYLLVVNAVNRSGDSEWIRRGAEGFDVRIRDRSDEMALIAVQGPHAREVLERVGETDVSDLRRFRFMEGRVAGEAATISRTGYTGEDGFEIFLHPDSAVKAWNALLDAGSELGLLPCGLGARDTLRIEAGLPLHGAELDEEHTPLEAGLGWVVKLGKGEFIGRTALVAQADEGVDRRRVGIRLEDRGFPRAGYPVAFEGEEIGRVTSGTVSPTLEAGIAMAYVPSELAEEGTSLEVVVRGRAIAGRVVALPFHAGRRPTG